MAKLFVEWRITTIAYYLLYEELRGLAMKI